MLERRKIQLFKIIISSFTANLGSQIFSFGIGLFILKETGSALGFGLIIMIPPLLSVLLAPLAGYIVDKYNRKRIVMNSQIGSVVVLLIFLITTYFSDFSLAYDSYYYYLLLLILGFLAVFDKLVTVSFSSSLASLVLDEDLERSSSFLQVSNSLAMIFAPILGSILFAFQNFSSFIFIVIFTETLALVVTYFINYNFNKKVNILSSDSPQNIRESFTSAVNYINNHAIITYVILIAIIANFFITSTFIGLPFVVINHFQVSNWQYGLIESGIAIGIFVTGLIMGILKSTGDPLKNLKKGINFIALLIMLLSIPLFIEVSNSIVTAYYLILNIILGSVATFINVPLMVILHRSIAENFKGRVFSVFFTLIQLFNPLGIFIFGILFDLYSPAWLFVISGSLVFGITIISHRLILKKRSSILLEI